jgi:ABC-2 type transport system ATP-binding protein
VAYLPQEEVALDEVPVGVAIEQTGRLRGLSRAEARGQSAAVMTELGLTALRSRACGRLSGGQRRLAGIACALIGDRPVLVLDEPTTGLDPIARGAVWAALGRRRDAGAAVLLVTHNVHEAETVLDRVAVLSGGRLLVCDTPGHVKGLAGDEVRLELVWRGDPPDDPVVADIARRSTVSGRRWIARMSADDARAALAWLTTGATLHELDDFTLSMPTLEDAYLALGGAQGTWDVAA